MAAENLTLPRCPASDRETAARESLFRFAISELLTRIIQLNTLDLCAILNISYDDQKDMREGSCLALEVEPNGTLYECNGCVVTARFKKLFSKIFLNSGRDSRSNDRKLMLLHCRTPGGYIDLSVALSFSRAPRFRG